MWKVNKRRHGKLNTSTYRTKANIKGIMLPLQNADVKHLEIKVIMEWESWAFGENIV